MSSLSSEAAKNPCVPLEQNGLVVTERVIQTGVTVSVPKLKIESLKGQIVFLIGDKDTIESFGSAFIDERHKTDPYTPNFLFKVNQKVFESYWKDHNITVCYRTILDIPQEYRSKGIVICFDEPSYNGRQCLYHLFGSGIAALSQEACAKFSAKPYQAFTQLMEGTQDENKSAIVFVPKALQNKDLKEVMWCPAKLEKSKLTPTTRCPPIPQKELDKVYWKPDVFVKVGRGVMYPVDKLPSTLKDWISSEFPGTNYVNFGPSAGLPKGIRFNIWGWNELPKTDTENTPSKWWSTFDTVFETTSSFKEFIDTAVENAKARKNIYTKEIAYTILKMPNPPSTILFDAPLVDTTQRGYRRISSNELKEETLYRDCDVLVGFIADTDATFDLVLDNDGVWDSPVLTVFPFRMKAGEFCLAWRDKGILPSVRMVYHHMWVQNLQGSVRRVGMLMSDTDERRKFVQADEFPLDSDGWVSSAGMIGKKKE